MVPNSAAAPPATMNRPVGDSIMPVSRSTGNTMPTEVADRAVAISSGERTKPAAPSGTMSASPMASDATKPMPPSRSGAPRSRRRSSSIPARKSRKATPRLLTIWTTGPGLIHPRMAGPKMMPATSSSTTAGTRSLGTKPSVKGTRNAMSITPNRLTSVIFSTGGPLGTDRC